MEAALGGAWTFACRTPVMERTQALGLQDLGLNPDYHF